MHHCHAPPSQHPLQGIGHREKPVHARPAPKTQMRVDEKLPIPLQATQVPIRWVYLHISISRFDVPRRQHYLAAPRFGMPHQLLHALVRGHADGIIILGDALINCRTLRQIVCRDGPELARLRPLINHGARDHLETAQGRHWKRAQDTPFCHLVPHSPPRLNHGLVTRATVGNLHIFATVSFIPQPCPVRPLLEIPLE